jgi:hypothetical protein
VWSVVTKESATVSDVIKNSDLFDAVRSGGYMQLKTKFTCDTRFLRNDPQIGVVKHGSQYVYRGLKWLNTSTTMFNGANNLQQFN